MQDEKILHAAEQFSTPFYVFDKDVLESRVSYLEKAIGERASLCYAMKANPFLIKTLAPLTERLEVCSPGEFRVCLGSGVPLEKLVISGVYKDEKDTEMMIEKYPNIGIYTAESIDHWEQITKYAEKFNRYVKVLLRLTSSNQFGMEKEDIKKIILEKNPFVDIVGIQYFSGTQKTSIKRIARELEKADAFLLELKEELGFEAKEFEYGAGLPVSYFQNDKEFDEKEFLKEFSLLLSQMSFKGKIILELGRFISASCGEYVTKAVDIKTAKGQNYCITDGGMNHISYYGQSMAMKIPKMRLLPERKDALIKDYALCGALCTANDLYTKQVSLREIQQGDIFVFENAGAYCMTEGISLFLTRDLPAILTYCEKDGFSLIRERTSVDFLNTAK